MATSKLTIEAAALPLSLCTVKTGETCSRIPVMLLPAPMPKWALTVLMSKAKAPDMLAEGKDAGPVTATKGGVIIILVAIGRLDGAKGEPLTAVTKRVNGAENSARAEDVDVGADKE